MNIPVIFFSFLGLCLVIVIAAIVNMGCAINGSSFEKTAKRHLYLMIGYLLTGVGTLGFGIAWIVQALNN